MCLSNINIYIFDKHSTFSFSALIKCAINSLQHKQHINLLFAQFYIHIHIQFRSYTAQFIPFKDFCARQRNLLMHENWLNFSANNNVYTYVHMYMCVCVYVSVFARCLSIDTKQFNSSFCARLCCKRLRRNIWNITYTQHARQGNNMLSLSCFAFSSQH